MEYTKGNWALYQDDTSTDAVVATDNCTIGRVFSSGADAHLIAAAPDMYEALKTLRDRLYAEIAHHPEPGDYRKTLQAELRQVESALAKAEGK